MASETVSVLFTDLVKSTELLSEVGEERAEEIRREFYELLRRAIASTGGHEVKNLGDGLMVAFDSVIAALSCGIKMQQNLYERNCKADEPLSLRVGISSGEVDVDEGDYFGIPVVEAARLCAVAADDQILTTEIVRLLAGSRGDFELAALGPMELKGLDAPVVVHEVRWQPPTPIALAVPLPARVQRADGAVFVGRTAQQALLEGVLKDTDVSARRRVVLLSGEAGIGKTTLVSAFAVTAHAAGSIVLYGRCDEDLSVPYEPWVEALTHLVEHAPEDLLRAHVAECGLAIVTLVPGLTRHVDDLPAPPVSDPDTERQLMFRAVVDLLARASSDTAVVLVLDDLHWADGTTLQLLRHVVVGSTPLRLLVLGTFRDTDLNTGHPLTALLAALHRERGAERLRLDGLDDVELLALMEAAAGHEMDAAGIALRDELLEETNGNPFFAVEILRHLVETGTIAQAEAGRWVPRIDHDATGLPVSVREVVGRRVQRLGEDAAHVLSTAAVIGRDFDLALLARAVDLDESRLLDVLDEATRAFVISEVPGALERYTFVHALIQRTLYDDLSTPRRRRLHRRIAQALEGLVGARTERVVELAHHWFEAMQPEDAPTAFAYAVAAGDDAQARLAPDEAVRWFAQALGLAEQIDTDRGETLMRLGVAQRLAGMPEYRETLLEAAAWAEAQGDTERLVAAALANTRGFSSKVGEVDEDRIRVLRAALDAVGDSSRSQRSRLLAQLGVESFYAPGVDVTALLDEALNLTSEHDDVAGRLVVLRAFELWFVPATLERRRELLDATEAVVAAADPVQRAWFESERCQVDYQDGDATASRAHHDSFQRAAGRIADPAIVWAGMFADAMCAMHWNDTARAEELIEDAHRYADAHGQPDAFEIYAGQLTWLRRMQGRAGEIIDLVSEVARTRPGIPAFCATLAHMYTEVGQMDAARRLLDAFCAARLDQLRVDIVWAAAMSAIGQAASAVEHRETARQLVPLIEPFPEQMAYSGCTIDGPLALSLGAGYRLLGRYDEAESAFRQSIRVAEGFESPFFVAVTHIEWARLLHERDAGPEASQHLQDAITLARAGGYPSVVERAGALLAP